MRKDYEEQREVIRKLYSEENRSISYIARLFNFNRSALSKWIHEQGFTQSHYVRGQSPSTKKLINGIRQLVVSRLNHDVPMTEISEELCISIGRLCYLIDADDAMLAAKNAYVARLHDNAERARQNELDRRENALNWYESDLDGEIWKPILGFENYEVSNMGRIRHQWYQYKKNLVTPHFNSYTGYYEVRVFFNGKNKALRVHRVVAHAFCDRYSEERNQVNHKDGDKMNNRADNLEWCTVSENNTHAYRVIGRKKVRRNKALWKKVVYAGKYEFSTVAALARFLGKSETQVRRYLEHPEQYNLEIHY